ncbi:EpsG family protein [Psychroflexus salarius]|uniref:EpsG family protein n=1 Tax=Psychroflexus salarius TaxID=1155689 RepID=A0A1M4V5L5_9FLAO|nr:EpsG family protein [Psychroflexus salarius]SHE64197.1 EpsG family protein [Psychroflexus salarius]
MFLFWPLMAVVKAVENFDKPFSKKIIMAFFALYGFCFVIDSRMDGERYAERLELAYTKPFSSFFDQLFDLYNTSLDFLQPLITYIISRFTDSHHVLFAVYALIFGFFYLKSIGFVMSKIKPSQSLTSKLYIVLLVVLIPIFNINGFRMWTAAWIFILGALHVVWDRDYKYLLLCVSACFMHFSFLGANVVLVAWIFAGNRPWLYLMMGLVTMTVSEINFQSIQNIAEQISPAFDEKASAYASEQYADKVSEQKAQAVWFMKLSPILLKSILIFNSILLMFKYYKNDRLRKAEVNILSFSLLFLSYANIVSLVPSGGRFLSVFYVLSVINSLILIKYWQPKITSIYSTFSLAFMALPIIISLRVGFSTLSTVVLSPSIVIPFGYDLNWSFLDVIL